MIEAANRVLATHKPPVPAPVEPPKTENAPAQAEGAGPSKDFKLFGADGFTFFDVLDIINPLQHIPVVSSVYRRLTGDELSPGARIAGATLFGGPIGAALAMADSAFEYKTGQDIGGTALAALLGDDTPAPDATMVAQARLPARDAQPIDVGDTMIEPVGSPGGGTGTAVFVAASAPDLGALASYLTGAGATPPVNAAPIDLAPRAAVAAWQPPAPTTGLADAAIRLGDSSPAPTPASNTAERPKPSEAAVAQAINALAQMPTSQTSAAIAELASNEPRTNGAARTRLAPPPSDIPRGAAGSLSRGTTRAYANAMTQAAKADAASAPTPTLANTTAVGELQRSTAAAQGDWIVSAMQTAMAKYEAGARLRSANATTNDDISSELAVVR